MKNGLAILGDRQIRQSVTKCNQLKMEAADGKKYLTDAANVETILRLIQSIPIAALLQNTKNIFLKII